MKTAALILLSLASAFAAPVAVPQSGNDGKGPATGWPIDPSWKRGADEKRQATGWPIDPSWRRDEERRQATGWPIDPSWKRDEEKRQGGWGNGLEPGW